MKLKVDLSFISVQNFQIKFQIDYWQYGSNLKREKLCFKESTSVSYVMKCSKKIQIFFLDSGAFTVSKSVTVDLSCLPFQSI